MQQPEPCDILQMHRDLSRRRLFRQLLRVRFGCRRRFSALPESLIFFTASESGAAGAGLMAGFSIALIGLSSAIDKADTTPPIS